jgi:phospholipid/cholesterol/gamma-HCH transport system substrate-binding protein
MDERVMQFRVGVTVLGALLAAAILLVTFGQMPVLIGAHYSVRVAFNNAYGVTKGTSVKKNGIRIGSVGRVDLAHEDREVMMTLEIEADKDIYQDERFSIERDLMGNKAIIVEQLPQAEALAKRLGHVPIDRDAIQKGLFSDDPTGLTKAFEDPIGEVRATGRALNAASKKLGEAADRVKDILDVETEKKLKNVLDNMSESLEVLNRGLGGKDNRDNLEKAIHRLPKTLDKMERAFDNAERALAPLTREGEDGKTPVDRLANAITITEKRMREFSEPDSRGNPAPIEQIKDTIRKLDDTVSLVDDALKSLKNGDGSLGKFLNDPELYDRLNRSARNVERLTRELRPIVDDAGVIMDKAARHPGVFIRDAIKPGAGIK